MFQALRYAEDSAGGGAERGSEAILHPLWQGKSGLSDLHQRTSAPGLKLLLDCLRAVVSDFG
eukprot:1026326-Pelagomonas_calceolata.AAC.1